MSLPGDCVNARSMPKRVILIVLDSCGVGALPDASDYGDQKCNTLGNIATSEGGLNLPNLEKMGLGNIIPIEGVRNVGESATAAWGKASSLSKGKDTTAGHYEIAGIVVEEPFPTYPGGFPKELIDQFCDACNVDGVLGNKAASGTEIISELAEEHIRTGLPIVYTSADSVFQIAAHESVIPPEKLWEICEKTLAILKPPHNISRVIARPFVGENGDFTRTANRRDFTQSPPSKSLLDFLSESGHAVYGIGKIEDIYNKQGVTKAVHTKSNLEGIQKTIQAIQEEEEGLIFTNLVDFDMKFGHRNDPTGYATALKEFDDHLPEIVGALREEDILIITADHGCDPTISESTDHTREYIPSLCQFQPPRLTLEVTKVDLGVRESFADIGKTIADYFGIGDKLRNGKSFLNRVRRG